MVNSSQIVALNKSNECPILGTVVCKVLHKNLKNERTVHLFNYAIKQGTKIIRKIKTHPSYSDLGPESKQKQIIYDGPSQWNLLTHATMFH